MYYERNTIEKHSLLDSSEMHKETPQNGLYGDYFVFTSKNENSIKTIQLKRGNFSYHYLHYEKYSDLLLFIT